MKVIFAIVALAVACNAASLSEEQKEKLINHHKECSVISGVDQELVTKARKGEFTDDAKLKEHLFCVAKKIGFQNEAGEIQNDVLKTKISTVITDEAAINKLVEKCAVKKDTPQNTAYETIKCYHDNTPTHITIV